MLIVMYFMIKERIKRFYCSLFLIIELCGYGLLKYNGYRFTHFYSSEIASKCAHFEHIFNIVYPITYGIMTLVFVAICFFYDKQLTKNDNVYLLIFFIVMHVLQYILMLNCSYHLVRPVAIASLYNIFVILIVLFIKKKKLR